MSDLWGTIDAGMHFEENRAIDILREQAELLARKTKGIVKASFSKVEYNTVTSDLQKTVSRLLSGNTEIEDVELADRKDFKERYRSTYYKFEIYNSEYKYRIFKLDYRIEFPIFLEIDEDISYECDIPHRIEINSNEQLNDNLELIFGSSKVRTVISRMLQEANKGINYEKLIRYLEEHSNTTLKAISEELEIATPTIKKMINDLSDAGSIEIVIKNGKKQYFVKH